MSEYPVRDFQAIRTGLPAGSIDEGQYYWNTVKGVDSGKQGNTETEKNNGWWWNHNRSNYFDYSIVDKIILIIFIV